MGAVLCATGAYRFCWGVASSIVVSIAAGYIVVVRVAVNVSVVGNIAVRVAVGECVFFRLLTVGWLLVKFTALLVVFLVRAVAGRVFSLLNGLRSSRCWNLKGGGRPFICKSGDACH